MAIDAGISLSGVSKSFSSGAEVVHAVDDVTMQVPPGAFVCLVGPSGCGKSTLLAIVAGLEEADAGSVEVAGVDIVGATESQRSRMRRSTIGVIFQDHELIPEFTLAENVAFPRELDGMSTREALAEASWQLERVGLSGLGSRRTNEVSGGQKQRAGIARALMGDRRVLIADEATGSLDSANAHLIFELFRDLAQGGVTVLAATHDPIAREYAKFVYEMGDGSIVGQDHL